MIGEKNLVPLYYIGLEKEKNERKNDDIFLTISCNISFGCSKELSHPDSSFEYPQHMFWMRNLIFIYKYALLPRGLVLDFFLSLSAYMRYYDNPKGSIPTWLINWAAKVSSIITFTPNNP